MYSVKSILSARIIFLVEISNECTTHVHSPTPQPGRAVHFLRSLSTLLHRVFTAALPFFCHLSNFKQKPRTIAGRAKQITFSLSLSLSFWFRFWFRFSFPLPFAHIQLLLLLLIFILILIFVARWHCEVSIKTKTLGHCGTVLWRCVFFRIGTVDPSIVAYIRSSIPFRESGARVLCPLVKLSINVASFRRLPHVAHVGPRKDTTAPDEQEVQEEELNSVACARTRLYFDSDSDYGPIRAEPTRPDSVGCWEFRKICIFNSRQMRMQMQIPWKSHIVYRLQAEIKLMLIFAFTFFWPISV